MEDAGGGRDGVRGPGVITNHEDLFNFLGADWYFDDKGRSEKALSRRVYKDTECGAWARMEPDGVTVGSIVDGSDAEVMPTTLRYPFEESAWERMLEEIEAEADRLWKEANEEEDED